MDINQSNLAVRKLLAKYSHTDPDDWFLTFRARLGMAVCFEAIYDIYGSGEVITQPYTCITAINPIIAGNLKPIYADIDPATLSINQPENVYSSKTHAIVLQHTLGIIGDKSQEIAAFAKKHRLILIEDSAHCLARMATDKSGSPLADISVHSFGVEKVLQNTKFGGAIYVNPALKKKNRQLYDKITSHLLDLPQPPRGLNMRARTYRAQNSIIQHLPSSMRHGVRDFARKIHFFEPAIMPYEQDAEQSRAYASTKFINTTILQHLPALPSIYKRRLTNTRTYHKKLATDQTITLMTNVDEPLLTYPILFPDAATATKMYDILTSSGFFIRRWYSPLLYPGPNSNRRYDYNPKMAPIAESIHARVLCLPTDLTPEKMKRIIAILHPIDKPVEKIIK